MVISYADSACRKGNTLLRFMPVLQLAVREVKLEIGSHEWDRYGVLAMSFGKTVKRCPPSYCEGPFITKWGNAQKKKPLAVFTAQSLSQLYDSTVGVDIYTGPVEQGPFDRLFGRSEFYLSSFKIKRQHELLHLTSSVYDPLRRETNVRQCPRMILKCTWFYKKEVAPSAPRVRAIVDNKHVQALYTTSPFAPSAPSASRAGALIKEGEHVETRNTRSLSPSRRHSWPSSSSQGRSPLAPLPATTVSNAANVESHAPASNKLRHGTNVDHKLVNHVGLPNGACVGKSQNACGGGAVARHIVKDPPKTASSARPTVRLKKFAPEKRELKETLKLLLDGAALMRDLANK